MGNGRKSRKRKPLGEKENILNLIQLDKETQKMHTQLKKTETVKVSEPNKSNKISERVFKTKISTDKIINHVSKSDKKSHQQRNKNPNVKDNHSDNLIIRIANCLPNDHVKQGNDEVSHNLRRLPPKVYTEEDSTLISSDSSTAKIPKTKNFVPIYKRPILEEPKTKVSAGDMYEFTDFSPKVKIKARQHRSSIVFDKETHEILKKIEEKEAKKAKVKKKVAKNKKLKPYNEIVSDIVLNVKQKILEKNKTQTAIGSKTNEATNDNIQDNINLNSPSVPAVGKHSFQKNSSSSFQVPSTQLNTTANTSNNNYKLICSEQFTDLKNLEPVIEETVPDSDNNSDNDVQSCFGFEEVEPLTSTPVKRPAIKVLSNIQLTEGIHMNNESPIDFHKQPNANSTMFVPNKLSSPWRLNWKNVRHSPYFISIKSNALPRIDQEPVLDHTIVDSFEGGCMSTPKNLEVNSSKKKSVQQSMLAFVDSTIDTENVAMHGSLFDYEAFNSPVKSNVIGTKAVGTSRTIIAGENTANSSVTYTNYNRRGLADITNTSIDNLKENVSYFGFDETLENKEGSPVTSHDKMALPTRFDVSKLKRYIKKIPAKNRVIVLNSEIINDEEDVCISDIPTEISAEEDSEQVHLFDEPEEILANMTPPSHKGGKSRRKRLNSTDSDISNYEKKRRKIKKTKAEIEQEYWVKEFNKMCQEVEDHELELD